MIRFDALFSTVLASSFCAANRNTHTHTQQHTQQAIHSELLSIIRQMLTTKKCWQAIGLEDVCQNSGTLTTRRGAVMTSAWLGHRERQRWSQRTDCKDIGRGDVRRPIMVSTARTAQLITTKSTLAMAAKWTAVRLWPTNLSWHISFSCLASRQRGSKRVQNWHGAGSSEIAFSTARLRLHNVRLISQRQPGHVAVSSLRRASANRCERQLAHIRWPFVHCNSQTDRRDICNCRRLTLLHCCNTVQKWSNICINQVKKIYKHTDVNKKSMSCHYNTRYNKWDTWTKLVPMGNTEGRNGYYVTNDVTVGWRSFCLHTFGIFREDKMSLIQSKCMN